MRALYQPPPGFRGSEREPVSVTILGFVEATIELDYERHGSKRCIVAVVADEAGRLITAELSHLNMQKSTE
jgi:hypothetical protein